MKRSGIYWVNLGPSQPQEFGKTRPGLVGDRVNVAPARVKPPIEVCLARER